MSASIRSLSAAVALFAVAAAASLAGNPPHSAPMEVTNGRPFVMVMVNGQGPFKFVVDTGTGAQAFVTPQFAERMGLSVTGHARLSDPSKQTSQRVPMHLLQSIQIAGTGVEFARVTALEHSLGPLDSSCQGLLGFTLFRDSLLTLDYPNQRIVVASGALAPDGERYVLPFQMPQWVPVVRLRVGGLSDQLEFDAQIDSGGGGLSLPALFASRLKFATRPAVAGSGQSLAARYPFQIAQLAADIHLGVFTFKRPFIEILPAFPLANFGSRPMRNFALTFDQKNGLVRFECAQKTIKPKVELQPMQPLFAAGEWQTPGVSITYQQPD